MARDSKTESEALARLDAQASNEERIKRANVVLTTQYADECVNKRICREAFVNLQWRLLDDELKQEFLQLSKEDQAKFW